MTKKEIQNKIRDDLSVLDKTNKEEVIKFIKKQMPYLAFYWETVYGFPYEMFKEEINTKFKSNGEVLMFILDFMERK